MENNTKLEKLTINKINEYPQEYSIMNVEEQMAAKGGFLVSLTFLGGLVVTKAIKAGTAKAAISKGTAWAKKNGLALLSIGIACYFGLNDNGGDTHYTIIYGCCCPPESGGGEDDGEYGYYCECAGDPNALCDCQ